MDAPPPGDGRDRVFTPAQSIGYQFWILFLATGMLVAALLLHRSEGNEETKLQLLGTSGPLPELCMSKRLFGMECPGCGLTRSVVASSRGQWSRAMHHHPAGPIIFGWALVQIPYRLGNLWRIRTGRDVWRLPGAAMMVALISAVCLVQWVIKSTPWF